MINTHYLGLKRTGGSAKICFIIVGGEKPISVVTGKKGMVHFDQSSYTSKNLGG